MYRLPTQDFPRWFRSLYEQDPFPWQVRLFHQWLCPPNPADARWPSSISLPPASGKTSLIDLAVFALACGSPCARRRVAFVVDRRIIVDEAAHRAGRIAAALRKALEDGSSPLHPVARALEEIGADPGQPLLVARLRGGLDLDDSWASNPAQPAVILSTVDQVGSRLLFRAYGATGSRSWPVVAGLLGVDTLILIDEAHCARPFCQTVAAIQQRWQKVAEQAVGPEIIAVQLSATLAGAADFDLEEPDYRCDALARRLRTPKEAVLVTVEPPSRKNAANSQASFRRELEAQIIDKANQWLNRSIPGVLAVIVNRVASARNIFERLQIPEERKLLLTGRVRPWERERILESWLPRIRAGRKTQPATGPLAVVATQCIEVGADLDFDYLITEAASIDALRQRFGRLDRLGCRAERLPEQHGNPAGLAGEILIHQKQAARNGDGVDPDPVYGHSLAASWEFLSRIASDNVVDFCHESLSQYLSQETEIAPLLQSQPVAYPLLPAYLDLLSHTSPPPEADVEIGAFLHGSIRPAAEVTLVWRAGLDLNAPDEWADAVALQPPAPGEGCPVPLWEARSWLSNRSDFEDRSHDLEGAPFDDSGDPQATPSAPRLALAWRGPDDSVVRKPEEIRAGELLIVPCEYGGCTEFGWNPASKAPVQDIGDAVAASLGRRAVIRLAALDGVERYSSANEEGGQEACPAAIRDDLLRRSENWREFPEQQEQDVEDFLVQLKNWAGQKRLDWLQSLCERLGNDGNRQVVTDPLGRPAAIVGSRSRGEDALTSSDTSTFRRGRPVLLDHHLKGVADIAAWFADRLALDGQFREALLEAARYHDLGKRDPRFQAWLAGRALATPDQWEAPLAKSYAVSPRNWPAIRRARLLSGYPMGNRHEALSVAILMAAQNLLPSSLDRDLVLHLVGSHHGYGRPWFPVVDDPDAPELNIDLPNGRLKLSAAHHMHQLDRGAVARFRRLLRRYGWWGLAYLEAVLRLADQRRSMQEEAEIAND